MQALCYARKVPLIYGRAGLNNWRAFADSKVASVRPARDVAVLGHAQRRRRGRVRPDRHAGRYYGPTPNQPPEARRS